jgi:hypothetical protein
MLVNIKHVSINVINKFQGKSKDVKDFGFVRVSYSVTETNYLLPCVYILLITLFTSAMERGRFSINCENVDIN